MKFCYLDESGTGSEPFAVMVGIVVDAHRMHKTKAHWRNLMGLLDAFFGHSISELKTKDLYKGRGPWFGVDGDFRAGIISNILRWLRDRKHKISFSGVDCTKFKKNKNSEARLTDMQSVWCMLGLHQILIIQKNYQKEEKHKGNTVLIFDEEVRQKTKFGELIKNPPEWTDSYYKKGDKKERLDQVVDVPYYGDSRDVALIQTADVIAYILRRYVEIKENVIPPNYKEEENKIDNWVSAIMRIALPKRSRYPSVGRDPCSELFYAYAPPSLSDLE